MDQLSSESLLQIERDLALALSAASDLPATLRSVLHAARQVAGIDCGGVYLLDEKTGALDLIYTEELPPEFVASAAHFAADAPQTHLVMAGQALYTHLARLSPLMDHVRRSEDLRAIVILPIAYEGRVIAALNLGSHGVDDIPPAGRAALEMIAAQLGGVISRIQAETALRESRQNLQTLSDSVQDLVASDITERNRAAEERLEMERRLLHAQKLESLGVLAGGIAHDFNSLLGAILAYLELALLDIPSYSPARENLHEATEAVLRAVELTRQMLAYAGKGDFIVEAVDLSELVNGMARLLKVSISRNATLRLSLDRALPRIQADPAQIQQIVMNLITNASEALSDQVGVVSVTTGLKDVDEARLLHSRLETRPPAGPFVYLEVADTGCGMDLDTLQRLFDPFFTTKFTGRGLGMSSVLGIVRAHRGAILVDSEMGVGTTITVFFPVMDAGQTAQPRSLPRQARTWDAKGNVQGGAILVVDDETAMRRVCATMLERLGFRALAAADGEEGVAVFRQHADEVLCVILDLTMPRLDGMAVLEQLRDLQPDVKVILSSGYTEAEILPQFAGRELAGYIGKPYQLSVLRAELERVLGAQS